MAKRGWTVKNLHGMMTCASRTLSKYVIGKTKVVLRSENKIILPWNQPNVWSTLYLRSWTEQPKDNIFNFEKTKKPIRISLLYHI
jgi:hypothetical protein